METKPTVALATNRDDLVVELRHIERFSDGSGFACTMFVRCHGFSAERPFYFSERSFGAALPSLRRMEEELTGEARLDEIWEQEQFLQLTMQSLGHVLVTRQLVEQNKDETRFSFSFRTDQTCLPPFLHSLEALEKPVPF